MALLLEDIKFDSRKLKGTKYLLEHMKELDYLDMESTSLWPTL